MLPSIGSEEYLDLNGQVARVAVPFALRSTTSISSQALLSPCAKPEDPAIPYLPGSVFFRKQTFPGDPRLDGVNYQQMSLVGFTPKTFVDSYDAPIRKPGGTVGDLYEKDLAGQYKIQKAYPDIYILSGIAGAGEFGRELYFGLRYVRRSTADGLPGYEP